MSWDGYHDYRERCIETKGEQCHICDSAKNIDVHHIDGNWANNDLSNLIPVCHNCHSKIHTKTDELAEWSEKILPREEREQLGDDIAINTKMARGQYERINRIREKNGLTWEGMLVQASRNLPKNGPL